MSGQKLKRLDQPGDKAPRHEWTKTKALGLRMQLQ